MEKLKEANLYRAALMPIAGLLVQRYNGCLLKLGFEPTKLSNFSIDGMGWSPEIAKEKKNIHYLNKGEANPHAIIISPHQKDKPVYVPFHSFDRDIMHYIFDTYENIINDITRDSAICVELDQFIDAFKDPFDLLKYQTITIGFKLLNDLDSIQNQQNNLIEHFNKDNNFIDENIHLQILASVKKHGDLRNRQLTLKTLEYQTQSFYTKAFGGVFVIREGVNPILIFESDKWYYEAIKDTTHDVLIYKPEQDELFEKLKDYLLISFNIEKAIKNKRYERIKKFLFAERVGATNRPIKEILNNDTLFKGYLNSIDNTFKEVLLNVKSFSANKVNSNKVKISVSVDKPFYWALHKPHSSLSEFNKKLLWKLLVGLAPKDPLHMFWYNKELFYKKYNTWDESLKDWVIDCITENNDKFNN